MMGGNGAGMMYQSNEQMIDQAYFAPLTGYSLYGAGRAASLEKPPTWLRSVLSRGSSFGRGGGTESGGAGGAGGPGAGGPGIAPGGNTAVGGARGRGGGDVGQRADGVGNNNRVMEQAVVLRGTPMSPSMAISSSFKATMNLYSASLSHSLAKGSAMRMMSAHGIHGGEHPTPSARNSQVFDMQDLHFPGSSHYHRGAMKD